MDFGLLILLEAEGSSGPEDPGTFSHCQLIPAALSPELWPAVT